MGSNEEHQARMVGLTGAYKGMEFPLTKDDYLVGRLPECDLVLGENTLSSKHAKISRAGNQYEIIDLNSTNGTFVNGERITRKILRADDRIRVDVYEFLFVNPTDVSRTILAKLPDLVKADKTVFRPLPDPDATRTQTPLPANGNGGRMFGGLLLGLALAFLIALGGHLLIAWSAIRFGSPQGLFVGQLRAFPLAFLHTSWINVYWSPLAIANLLCLLVGLFIGGLVTRSISRRSRFASAILFSFFFVLLTLLIQLAAWKFDVRMWQDLFLAARLGIGNPLLNLVVAATYFFWVSLIVSFFGTLSAKK